MRPGVKRVSAFVVVMLITLSCGVSVSAEPMLGSTVSERDTALALSTDGHKVIVYYLYFNPRCETCINMEIYSKEAVESGFPDELKEGSLEWHAYDMDSTEHAHYWDDFQLETKSLVIVDMLDGKMRRWKDCVKIWDLVQSKPGFMKYVQDEIRSYLSDD